MRNSGHSVSVKFVLRVNVPAYNTRPSSHSTAETPCEKHSNSNLTDRLMKWLLCAQKTSHYYGWRGRGFHYNDVIMGALTSQITNLTIVYSDADQRKHQSSASLAFVQGIHRWPVNFPHKRPVTRKMFPFDDVIMWWFRHAGGKWLRTVFGVCYNGKQYSRSCDVVNPKLQYKTTRTFFFPSCFSFHHVFDHQQ